MAHDHAHAHSHTGAHPRTTAGRAFAIAIALNVAFIAVETVYGLLSRSMALVADAGHNLGDVLALGLSWGAAVLAGRRPTARRTYGFHNTTIIASLANALLLLFVTGGIAWESVRRLLAPEAVAGKTVIVVALVGVVVNTLSSVLFLRDRKRDLNVRSAFLHMASDAALSLGVAVVGAIVLATGLYWLDAVASILLSLTILASTWSLLKESLDLVLAAVPAGIDSTEVKAFLCGLPGVLEVHDLHIWAVSTTETALTAHLIMAGDSCRPAFLGDVCHELHERFHIAHPTLQVEPPDAPAPCRLAADGHV